MKITEKYLLGFVSFGDVVGLLEDETAVTTDNKKCFNNTLTGLCDRKTHEEMC